MPVFFVIAPVAIAVLEVDSEVLHGFLGEFARDLGVHRLGEVFFHTDDPGEVRWLRDPTLGEVESEIAQSAGGVGRKDLSTSVDGVNRLALGPITRLSVTDPVGGGGDPAAPVLH